jgi:UPF0755 protein
VKIRIDSPRLRALALLVILGISAFTIHLVRAPSPSAPDFPCSATTTATTTISIAAGETGSSIAASLFAAGVVKSSESYFRVAVGDPKSQTVAPGNHRIDVGICARKALQQLLDYSRVTGLISVTEGAWLSEIVPQLYAAKMSVADVSSGIRNVVKPAGFTTLEGLLFPAQYSFEIGTSAKIALQSMVDRAAVEMKKAGFYENGEKLSAQKLLIIASLVQAEGNTKDFTKISQVIRNRMTVGMPLQFDSTVHYVKKSRGSVFLSTQSTLINSPYNTYKHYGLPPGPINNPGSEAMSAAAHPLAGDWLYFITVAPFDTRFTNNLDQFNTWKVEYEKNLKAGKFRSSQ